jgi:hypothetical protein
MRYWLQALFAIILLPSWHAGTDVTLARVTCKQVGSCEEAVALWCNGYRRADGDNDGIPCENVCLSLDEVEEIKSRQGC